jgi:proton glutamate symport protein
VPLIITSLLTGILGLGDGEGVGRMFRYTVLYYVSTSFLAIATGLLAVNLIRPGLSNIDAGATGQTKVTEAKPLGEVLFDQLEAMIPANPLSAVTEPNFLSIIAFTIAFALFSLSVGGETLERIKGAATAGFEVMMAMTTAIIRLAPIGVLFLIASVTATQGPEIFITLGWYVIAVAFALGIHAFITLPLILKFVAKRSPFEYAKAMSPALLTAFSSASSNGTLPLTMSNVEQRAGVSNRTGSFVLPLGATVNMDGTALYEAVAVLFIAQLHFGQNLPFSQQIIVAITALLASVGAAGIPHAGLVMMVIILQAVGLPIEMQGVILAVDRVLDMARTSVNVWSDSCGCAVVERLSKA